MDTITNVTLNLRSKATGKIYNAQYVVESPAGHYGMIWAWIRIDTEHGIFIDAYKPTILEATDHLREQMKNWERA